MPVAKRKSATKRKSTIAEERIERLKALVEGHVRSVDGLSRLVNQRLVELDRHSALRMQNYKALAERMERLDRSEAQLRSLVEKVISDVAAVERRQDNIDKAQLDVKNKLAEAKFYDARKISDHVAQLEVRTKQLGVDVVKLQNGQCMIYEPNIGDMSWAATGETAY